MPTTMPHASIGESMDAMRKQDMAISGIPEIETVVGKLGWAETALTQLPFPWWKPYPISCDVSARRRW